MTADDACDGTWSDICDPALATPACPLSGSTFGVGTETLVTCTATDSTSGPPKLSASCSLTVKVLSVEEVVAKLQDDVEGLLVEGRLSKGQGTALKRHLRNILRSLRNSRITAACAQLEGWTEQLHEWISDGVLTADEAAPLLGSAENLKATLACTP